MEDFYKFAEIKVRELIDSLNERAYFAKFIDAFLALPKSHKKAFLTYILEKVPKTHWEELFKDDTLWLNIIRGLLMEYSGREEMGNPVKGDLVRLIEGYVESALYNMAMKDGETSFMERLEEL